MLAPKSDRTAMVDRAQTLMVHFNEELIMFLSSQEIIYMDSKAICSKLLEKGRSLDIVSTHSEIRWLILVTKACKDKSNVYLI